MSTMPKGSRLLLSAALVLTTFLARDPAAQTNPAAAAACSRECLLSVMDRFVATLRTGRAAALLTADAEVRENTRLLRPEDTSWKTVTAVRSVMTFADPVTGNVVSRAGVELREGRVGYISTRVKVSANGRISDVEISADTSPAVVPAYVWNLDPAYASVVPPEQRSNRTALEALARRYFHSLSSHVAVAADFDPRCNRFHSGQQVTNVTGATVEAGTPRTCAAALEGTPPWGPATEQRFPVIDPERGIVFGVSLLHFNRPDQAHMYVSEIFKIVGGRIVRIDNIGLMIDGVATLGFTH
jgi:hypothetical protein